MTGYTPSPQVSVLDTGGQYCHLIARRVRELGVYADVVPSETPANQLEGRKGLIISGGPSSVYETGSPTVDPAIFSRGSAVLGICYGQHLIAHLLGGSVRKGDKGEFGLAHLDLAAGDHLWEGLEPRQQIWMSHRDQVEIPPAGFSILGTTETCAIAAIGAPERRIYGLQFHPEVVHTRRGSEILSNFVFRICACDRDWDPKHRIALIESQIRETAGDRNVFFFVSGGVDSTVAYTLCLRALGPERVRGTYVDTGLMREGETEFVEGVFASLSAGSFSVEHAAPRFLGALDGVTDPEAKRHIIGEQFVEVQEAVLRGGHYLDGHWILGQGTIYPDTIESGGTSKAEVIKTHHNRVAGIQRLIEAKRIIEPLNFFYKDEVREIGRELGLPAEVLERHPFPGPGLAIRCLCSESADVLSPAEGGWIVPIRSVGVQGDSRSYRAILAIERTPPAAEDPHDWATGVVNRRPDVNRVVALSEAHAALGEMSVFRSALSRDRLARLRRVDAIVRKLAHESGFDARTWQFPVILIPLGVAGRTDSVVLRPIDSVDGMTAQAVPIDEALLKVMTAELLQVEGVCGVFRDLTHKPPATIEWE